MVIVQHFGTKSLAITTDRYADNDRLAVFALTGGEHYTDLSVNMPEEELATDEFVFKTYSENEGLFEQLVEAAAIHFTGRFTKNPMRLPICRLHETTSGE